MVGPSSRPRAGSAELTASVGPGPGAGPGPPSEEKGPYATPPVLRSRVSLTGARGARRDRHPGAATATSADARHPGPGGRLTHRTHPQTHDVLRRHSNAASHVPGLRAHGDRDALRLSFADPADHSRAAARARVSSIYCFRGRFGERPTSRQQGRKRVGVRQGLMRYEAAAGAGRVRKRRAA